MNGPRFQQVEIDGFRSIDRRITLRLDAPVVLIHGQNGAGKTSLLSAIELALTGSIPSLEKADRGYRKQLLNYEVDHGEIILTVSGLDEVKQPISAKLTRGISRTPAGLPADLAQIFSERCYLPQSTLTQLLTIYGSDEGGIDTPLSRFAAELLGLDRLDALQRGLHPARDARNLRQLVPSYRTLEENCATLEAELTESEREKKALAAELKASIQVLEAESAKAGVGPGPDIDLSGETIQRDLTTVTEQARRAETLSRALQRLHAARAGRDRRELAASAAAAEKKVASWRRGPGKGIDDLLRRASALVQNTPPTIRPTVDRDIAHVVTELAAASERAKATEARARAAEKRAKEIEDELTRARISIVDLDGRIDAAGRAAPDLAAALTAILPHIHDENCPVCGRDYSEVSAQPLAINLLARVRAMSEAADQLARDSAGRSRLSGRVADLERERDALASTMPSIESRQRQQAEQSTFDSLFAEASAKMNDAAAGAEAMRLHFELVRALEGWTRAEAEEQVLKAEIAALEEDLDLRSDASGLQERIDACRNAVRARQARAQSVVTAFGSAREARAQVKALTARLDSANAHHLAKAEAKTRGDDALRAAKKVREATKRIGDAAAGARANAISQVFNHRLNSVWRDLFVRLAPDEPFVPFFDVPDSPGDRVRPVLKTIHRSGKEGGAPTVMLSSGNLNTAALALFLALHLAVRPRLPWLVLDDPVQSMDDVHIANFAALLRTLSKQHGRQILVAVHDRQLFDYLTLEMSPAFPGDELITIELERSAAGHIRPKDNRLGYSQPLKIVAAA